MPAGIFQYTVSCKPIFFNENLLIVHTFQLIHSFNTQATLRPTTRISENEIWSNSQHKWQERERVQTIFSIELNFTPFLGTYSFQPSLIFWHPHHVPIAQDRLGKNFHNHTMNYIRKHITDSGDQRAGFGKRTFSRDMEVMQAAFSC